MGSPRKSFTRLLSIENSILLGLPWVPESKLNQISEKVQKERKTVKQDRLIIV